MKSSKWKMALGAVVVSGLLLSWYWRDAPLSAQAIALDQPVLAAINEKENGYFYSIGLNVANEKDPAEVGKALIAQHETLLRANPPANAKQFQTLIERPRIEFVVTANEYPHRICRVQNEPCVHKFVQAADKLKKFETDNALLIERYEALLKYPHYAEVGSPSLYLPSMSYSVSQTLNELRCAKAAISLANGDTHAALESLDASIRFWHNNLRGSTTLVSRMLATANLNTDYYFFNDFLNYKPAIAQTHYDQIQKILAHFNADDTDFTKPIKGEFRYGAYAMRRMGEDTDELLSQDEILGEKIGPMVKMGAYLNKTALFRPNATINRHAEIFTRYLELARLPAYELIEKQQVTLENLQRDFDPDKHRLRDYTYNPFGNILLSTGLVSMSDYQLSVHSLDGYVRLLKLKVAIRFQAIPPTEVALYLTRADSSVSNPFTQQPMAWDAASGKLSFYPAADSGRKAIEVTI